MILSSGKPHMRLSRQISFLLSIELKMICRDLHETLRFSEIVGALPVHEGNGKIGELRKSKAYIFMIKLPVTNFNNI
jgi:hypothetical protein